MSEGLLIGVRIGICGLMGLLCLLASFGLDGILHQYLEDGGRIDLGNGINGARKFLLLAAGCFGLLMFL